MLLAEDGTLLKSFFDFSKVFFDDRKILKIGKKLGKVVETKILMNLI